MADSGGGILEAIMGVRLIDNSAKVKQALKERIAVGLNNAANAWVDAAAGAANVDTGFMKAHIGVTKAASSADLSAVIRSLAPYSMYQDTGMHGNLFWTRAYLIVRDKYTQFLYHGIAYTGSAGPGVIRQALQDYHGPLGNPRGGKP